ncbi:hypothetical protein PROFUN_03238 [Planoprotostelium fungivorum]|uniref:DUF1754-domain-containing protein n=1 Tax=Planoprotostelium fungivorum TaxID=1890364 RepID=A0A2P6NX42_9EUKA|nr:hypothetical protein PROFUN_03227 [Planoprotostelium fungivorum]PRP88521.1 hypothetical protein PROFUN_03238 [Planoprotostelium fungivorum]
MSDAYDVPGGKLKLKGVTKKKGASLVKKKTPTKEEVPAPKIVLPEDPRTESQKRYDEIQSKREMDQIKKKASKSHKQKVEEFNKYLGSLSEHHDIPKVGPG